MAERNLPDPNAPLTDWEKALLEKLLADPTNLPAKFKAWVADYVANNGSFHVDNLPSLSGEEWRHVGATGQPAFGTGWTNYGSSFDTVAFYKDPLGIVRLKGLAARTSGALTTIFTLPEGYRPSSTTSNGLIFVVHTGEPHAVGRVDINAAGVVALSSGNTNYVTLSPISFRAA